MEENPVRNRSIITRHYSGETLKSIAASIGLSYDTTVQWAGRHRGKIFNSIENGTDISTVAEEYSLPFEVIMQICEREFNKRADRQARDKARAEEREEEWIEYIDGVQDDAFEQFQKGEGVNSIAEDHGIGESAILSYIEDELSKRIHGRGEVLFEKYKNGVGVEKLVSEYLLSYEEVLRRISDELTIRTRENIPINKKRPQFPAGA